MLKNPHTLLGSIQQYSPYEEIRLTFFHVRALSLGFLFMQVTATEVLK